MPRLTGPTRAVLTLGGFTLGGFALGALAGCSTAPARYAGEGMHATYHAAATGASAVEATGSQLYTGAGRAIRAPLHDFNFMQDKIAPVLLRAEDRPYDLAGVNSCADVLNRVSELDLALGPDVDTPKERKKRVRRGADFAANAALDAAGSAAEHFIPMRSTIKQITGAQRYDNHVRHATMAGTVRRSFLKAVGMSHSCAWPAAPLDFRPVQVAALDAPWSAPAVAAPVALAQAGAPTALPAAVQPPVALVATAGGRVASAVFVPASGPLTLPSAAPPALVAGQSWRPAAVATLVAEPVRSTAALNAAAPGARALNVSAGSTPWGAPEPGRP